MKTLDLIFTEHRYLHKAESEESNVNSATHHSYLVGNAHGYGEDRAEDPDDENDHLSPWLVHVGPQREHYRLISVHSNGYQGEDTGVNAQVLNQTINVIGEYSPALLLLSVSIQKDDL